LKYVVILVSVSESVLFMVIRISVNLLIDAPLISFYGRNILAVLC